MAVRVARLRASELFSAAAPDVLARRVSLRYSNSTESEKERECLKLYNS